MSRWARRLAVLALGSIAALGLAELGVRLAAPQRLERGGLAYLDDVANDLRPDFTGTFAYPDYVYTVHTDGRRLRRTWDDGSGPSSPTVLVLGDSFAHGIGVEDDETIPSGIARGLSTKGIQARVANAGVPGYSPADSLCKFQRLRREVTPDVVVLVLSFNDAFSPPGFCEAASPGAPPVALEEPASLGARLHARARDLVLGHSHLGVLLAYRLNAWLIGAGLRPRFRGTAEAYDPRTYGDYADLVERTGSVLRALRVDAETAGARAVLVYVPGFLEADDAAWEAARRLTGERLSRALPRARLLAAARAAGFQHVVAPPADPSGRTAVQTLYFPLDMHLDPRGNAYVAALVVEALAAIPELRARRP